MYLYADVRTDGRMDERTNGQTNARTDEQTNGRTSGKLIGAKIILPKKALKRDNRYQRDKKRKLCKRRAAIEPIIGHLLFCHS